MIFNTVFDKETYHRRRILHFEMKEKKISNYFLAILGPKPRPLEAICPFDLANWP